MTGVTATSSLAVVNSVFVFDLEHYQLDAPQPPSPSMLGRHPPTTTWRAVANDRGERIAYFRPGDIVRG